MQVYCSQNAFAFIINECQKCKKVHLFPFIEKMILAVTVETRNVLINVTLIRISSALSPEKSHTSDCKVII